MIVVAKGTTMTFETLEEDVLLAPTPEEFRHDAGIVNIIYQLYLPGWFRQSQDQCHVVRL